MPQFKGIVYAQKYIEILAKKGQYEYEYLSQQPVAFRYFEALMIELGLVDRVKHQGKWIVYLKNPILFRIILLAKSLALTGDPNIHASIRSLIHEFEKRLERYVIDAKDVESTPKLIAKLLGKGKKTPEEKALEELEDVYY